MQIFFKYSIDQVCEKFISNCKNILCTFFGGNKVLLNIEYNTVFQEF